MRFDVVTLFPELIEPLTRVGLLAKAVRQGHLQVRCRSPREFAEDKHGSVDDTPYGGGSGMVMTPGPLVAAMEALDDSAPGSERAHRVLLTPQGARMTQAHAQRFATLPALMLVAARYEGIDERVREHVDEELSLGDFVLNGGEVAALAVVEATARLLPGVLGNAESLREESHQDGLLEYPQYTRPRVFRGRPVPDVLRSGDHGAIAHWRRAERVRRTLARRPDLLPGARLSEEERRDLAGARRTAPTYCALLHHPVRDRAGETVTAAITNLDVHDIARSARTYGLRGYYVVSPIAAQHPLVQRIVSHWCHGAGLRRMPERAEALRLCQVAESLEQVVADVERREGRAPRLIATAAAPPGDVEPCPWARARERVQRDNVPNLILFGTGHGLTHELLRQADLVLEPVWGPGAYNHLSVRAAAAVVLDRLFGETPKSS